MRAEECRLGGNPGGVQICGFGLPSQRSHGPADEVFSGSGEMIDGRTLPIVKCQRFGEGSLLLDFNSGQVNMNEEHDNPDEHSPRPLCPVCGGEMIEIRAKLQCSVCHTICETCCEGGRG